MNALNEQSKSTIFNGTQMMLNMWSGLHKIKLKNRSPRT